MPFERKRSDLALSTGDRARLAELTRARSTPHGTTSRAKVLAYANGVAINAIARELALSRPRVERCVDKALSGGVAVALADLPRSGRPPQVTSDERAWLVDLACQPPRTLGYPHEVWTYALLRDHIQQHAAAAGHPALARVSRSMVHAFLAHAEVKPHRMRYYLERRDPEFGTRMAQVLAVYREVAIANQSAEGDTERPWVVISYDEKPGLQALARVAPQLPPVPGQHPSPCRDGEHRRHGTVSLLASIDRHDGHLTALVRDHHRSREFVEFLDLLDHHYPPSTKLRLILDNPSAHVSKETMRWLKGRPSRFELVFAPKHGSRLNIIKSFFSKMARSLLRHLRARSQQELKQRIEDYVRLVNEDPVVFRWTWRVDEALV